jgi:hypothetical protein
MVSPSLNAYSQPRRDNSDRVVYHRIDDKQYSALHHAEYDKTPFAIILPIISQIDGTRVFEHKPRGLECDAMLDVIFGGFDFIPLEWGHHSPSTA